MIFYYFSPNPSEKRGPKRGGMASVIYDHILLLVCIGRWYVETASSLDI